jgi:hypothetical protein
MSMISFSLAAQSSITGSAREAKERDEGGYVADRNQLERRVVNTRHQGRRRKLLWHK